MKWCLFVKLFRLYNHNLVYTVGNYKHILMNKTTREYYKYTEVYNHNTELDYLIYICKHTNLLLHYQKRLYV